MPPEATDSDGTALPGAGADISGAGRERAVRVALLAAALVFIVFATLAWYLWEVESEDAADALQNTAETAARRISADLEFRLPSLQRMARRWATRGGMPRREWEADAAAYIRDQPGYQALEWVDRDFTVQWVVPRAGNEAAVGLDLGAEEGRPEALLKARQGRVPVASRPVDLVQGGKGFLVYFPIHGVQGFDGFILAVFHLERWLAPQLPEGVGSAFAIRIDYQGERLFETAAAGPASALTGTAVIPILGHEWQLRLTASEAYVDAHHSALPLLELLFGLFVSLVVAASLYFWLLSRTNLRELQAAQVRLEGEVLQRRQAENRLQEAMERVARDEQQLRAIVEQLPVGVSLWDEDNRLRIWNQRYFDYHQPIKELISVGTPLETIVRTVAPMRVAEGHADTEREYIEMRMAHRRDPGPPQLRRLGDGTIYNLRDHPLPTGGTIETITDITVEQRSRDALEQREQLLRDIFANLSEGVLYFDESDRLVRWNQAYAASFPEMSDLLHHRPTFEEMYRHLQGLLGHEGEALETAVVERLEHHRTGQTEGPFSYAASDGRHYQVWEAPVGSDGTLVTLADVTGLHQREAALRRSNDELEQFAYVASHDLREPLRTIESYSQLLNRKHAGSLDEEAKELIGEMVSAVQRMQSLLDDLLVYSRVQRETFEPDEVSLRDVAEQALDNLRRLIEETGANVTVGELPSVWGQESALIRLFQNLIDNAVKFTGEGQPRIEVFAQPGPGGEHVSVSVRDHGIGIDARHHARIFEPFRRLHLREEIAGNGIGLAVCAKIAEQHGGAITLQSESGQGSTFSVSLRAVRPGTGSGGP